MHGRRRAGSGNGPIRAARAIARNTDARIAIEPVGEQAAIWPPPNWPGGRLMLWITSRSIAVPAGRASKFGDGSAPARRLTSHRRGRHAPQNSIAVMDVQLLHPVAQLAQADAEQLRRLGAVELGLGQRAQMMSRSTWSR